MGRYRQSLPQLGGDLFISDAGIETTMIFLEGLELPCFAAFDLLKNDEGTATLRKYFRTHAQIAVKHGLGFILESATWRANSDWAAKIGYSSDALIEANRKAIVLLEEIRAEYENDRTKMVLSGCIGPRGDGYKAESLMTPEEAESYHSLQAEVFRDAGADMITAITMTYPAEAIGVTRAAAAVKMPVAISFTVETDGTLPSGDSLQSAIAQVEAATNNGPAYYMINCAHPTHFQGALTPGAWLERIRGTRVNASTKSHAELDEATELDAGNPAQLSEEHRVLKMKLKNLNVIGGCCGTDHRHMEEIAKACAPLFRQ